MLHLFEKQADFFDLFDQLAAHVVSSAEHLRNLAVGFPHAQTEVQHIRDEEHRADEVSHQVLSRLNHTFMPPIHGDDVHALTGGLDDIIDHIDALAKRFPLYHIDAVEPTFVRQTEVLLEATTRVQAAVHQLRRSRKLSDLSETLIEIHGLESLGDDNHHAALAHLFDGSCQPLFVLKWKELYTLAEKAIDACEDVGNIIERIVIKNA